MAVSRRVAYQWHCACCGSAQETYVWRIVDERERSDVVKRAGQELAMVTCDECGGLAEIDEVRVDVVEVLKDERNGSNSFEPRARPRGSDCPRRYRRHPRPDDSAAPGADPGHAHAER